MVYLHILSIRGFDWPEKINLAIMDRIPTEDEKKAIIREYWLKYENGHFEELDKFLEYLNDSPSKVIEAVRTGIWIERVALLANPDRLQEMFKESHIIK